MANLKNILSSIEREGQRATTSLKGTAERLVKSKPAETMINVSEGALRGTIGEIKRKTRQSLYAETAKALDELSDALLRETRGTTAKMTRIAAAKLGAVATSAGIFGLAATVGTAGTGTAIGTLSGGAATSATLAWVGGSVAMGSAIVAALSIVGGIGFAAGAFWVFHKYWLGKKRPEDDLSDREQRIIEVSSKLAVACRRLDAEDASPDPNTAKALFEEALQPLCKRLMDEEPRHTQWPAGALRRLRRAISGVSDIAVRMKHLGSKSPTITISVFAVTITQLLQGDLSDLTAEQEVVLEALRRSSNELNNATNEELIAYASSLSDQQLQGVINNTKGIYHEMLFVQAENTDSDQFSAALFEETNHPGADVIITDNVTGEVREVQLKATDYRSYIREHQKRYEQFEIFVTEEVSGDGIEGSGFYNRDTTAETEETLDTLRDAGDSLVNDAMLTSSMIALAYQLGRVLREKDFSEDAAYRATKLVAKTAFITGLATWALS